MTSNRDENFARSPQNITRQKEGNIDLIFPRDTAAGGTWIAAAGTDQVVCLLNGAFKRHEHNPPYRRSRGLMVLDFFDYQDTKNFFKTYLFQGMEPFTIVAFDRGALFEMKWDGSDKYLRQLDQYQPHIWSSATLYEWEVMRKRELWFRDWLNSTKDYNLENILHFHNNAGDGDPRNDVVMNREGLVQTVSITNILRVNDKFEMLYHDLLNTKLKKAKVLLQGEVLGAH